jgi:hypothetical protein
VNNSALDRSTQRGDGDWALVALIFACALTFCGTPDLHDALMSHVEKKCPNPNWQERVVPR